MPVEPPSDFPKPEPVVVGKKDDFILTPEQEENLDLYYERKYGAKLRAESMWVEGESTDSYLQRLLELYPAKNQQAYLKMFFATVPTGVYAMRALMAYAYEPEKPVHPKVAEYYPPELNTHLIGRGNDTSLRLKMSSAKSAEVIHTCNAGLYELKKWSHEEVKRQRETLLNLVTGKEKLPDGFPLRKRVKIGYNQIKLQFGKQIIGQQLFDDIVRNAVEESIPFDSLDADDAIKTFTGIANLANGPIDPIHFYVKGSFHPSFGLDDLDIYPDVGASITQAFDKPVRV